MFTFEVEGCGKFPMELLHEAKCYPADKEDAIKINDVKRRTIRLSSVVSQNRMLWFFKGWKIVRGMSGDKDDYELYHTWPC